LKTNGIVKNISSNQINQ